MMLGREKLFNRTHTKNTNCKEKDYKLKLY